MTSILKNVQGRGNMIIKGRNGRKETRFRIIDNYELGKLELVRFYCIF